jgi:Diguanylate cyclase, GGDEF domain
VLIAGHLLSEAILASARSVAIGGRAGLQFGLVRRGGARRRARCIRTEGRVPLLDRGRLLGALNLYRLGEEEAFSGEEFELAFRALESAVRHNDFVARLGGEEFALVLPQATPELVAEIGARIRARIAAIAVEQAGTITVLLGGATGEISSRISSTPPIKRSWQ